MKNPAFFFSSVWIIVLWLYSRHYALVLENLKQETGVFILLSITIFSLPFFLSFYLKSRREHSLILSRKVDVKLKKLLKCWILFSFVEILVFRSLPILSFAGVDSFYTEWGIPSLHGLLNAIIITISNIAFYKYMVYKKKKYLIFYFLCLCWPILLLTRQVLMSMILQMGLIYLYCNKIQVSKIFRYITIGVIVIVLFGLLGDLRSGKDAMENIAGISDDYPSFLPSGFIWVYVYITSPLNNLNHNLYLYPDFNFSPLIAFGGLFPSFIREKLLPDNTGVATDLVNDNLNVMTMHPQYLNAFGYLGALAFYFLYGCFVFYVYQKFRKESNAKWMFMTVVLTHNLILSVFVDFNINLVFLFQLFLHYYLGTNFSLKRIER